MLSADEKPGVQARMRIHLPLAGEVCLIGWPPSRWRSGRARMVRSACRGRPLWPWSPAGRFRDIPGPYSPRSDRDRGRAANGRLPRRRRGGLPPSGCWPVRRAGHRGPDPPVSSARPRGRADPRRHRVTAAPPGGPPWPARRPHRCPRPPRRGPGARRPAGPVPRTGPAAGRPRGAGPGARCRPGPGRWHHGSAHAGTAAVRRRLPGRGPGSPRPAPRTGRRRGGR